MVKKSSFDNRHNRYAEVVRQIAPDFHDLSQITISTNCAGFCAALGKIIDILRDLCDSSTPASATRLNAVGLFEPR
jgi:hypothetical protein